MKNILCLALFSFVVLSEASFATDCSRWPQFSSREPHLQPLSIPAAQIDVYLNGSPDMEGIEISANLIGRDLYVDVLHYPRTVTVAAALRVVFMIGRLSNESFDRLVLVDGDQALFYIAEPALRSVGCKFIWRQQGGENPIALMRDFYSALRHHDTDRVVVVGLNGSLLQDTQRVLQANNEVVLPAWIVSAID